MPNKMFSKILIANRGEIACRIIRTTRALGIRTVAVYSDADRDALHVAMADEAIHIGPPPARDSYLRADRIIEAALKTGAQAIHPGYGFLSENAEFCLACQDNGLVFIGPPVEAIRAMGSKSAAKNIMGKANVPLVPGYHGEDQSRAVLKHAADAMGYPVLLKAAAGGGGKGMRQVWNAGEFDQALDAAKREARNGFGDDAMLVEKYLIRPRHVEIQVFCDSHGNAVFLFERDCSVQRRHQKVIEEAPAPGLTQALRAQMGDAAIRAAQAIGYEGAGTVEFLLDSDGAFYFMEMNTRLQVEHPVTEMITGQDLVEWQLRVAAGETLPRSQGQLEIRGHAFEARIYAEDPDNDFLPATGVLEFLQPPQAGHHVRIDSGVLQGDEVSVYYDPMIAKLIVWDENRDRALQRLTTALGEYRISGLTTNIDFLYNLASSQPFADADLDTGFIERHHDLIFRDSAQAIDSAVPLAALYLCLDQARRASHTAAQSPDPWSPWHLNNGWRANLASEQHLVLGFHHQTVAVKVEQILCGSAGRYRIHWGEHQVQAQGTIEGSRLLATVDGHQSSATIAEHGSGCSLYTQQGATHFTRVEPDLDLGDGQEQHGGFTAPMNGTIVALLVDVGAPVSKGDTLLIMEAMKMEHAIKAPASGVVEEFYFQPGDLVAGGAELLVFAPAAGE